MARYDKIHIRMGNARLLLALATAFLAWASIARHACSPWWLTLPVAGFIGIAVYHARILRSQTLAARAAVFYRNGIARIEDRWAGTGACGERFADPHHVYSADLDLFGKASMFELLSTARTRMGEDTLAQWLLAPSTVEHIRHRHASIAELRERLDLREDLAALGEDARTAGVHPDALVQWTEAPNQLRQKRWLPAVAMLLMVLAVAFAIVWGVWGTKTPFFIVIILEGTLYFRLKKEIAAILGDADRIFSDLGLLSATLARIECEQFKAPRLQLLSADLRSHHTPASQAIGNLRTLVDLINSRDNMFVRWLDVPLLYSLQLAFAAERWRSAHGRASRQWLSVVGEIEALISLSAYSFEHPADVFPEFDGGVACFEAQALGHPLIPAAKCIRNDVHICGETRILLISGSNMSGKSTLMRAIGLNTVLAMAGAPVRAASLTLTPLRLGASIRVNDSLQEGSSRFYAEIKRLRQLFDLAGGDPTLLFLLDELLQGTNSHDRRIGAQGVVRALLEKGAIGLISTHDLALTDIDGPIKGHLKNVHFQDKFENGKMKFDYKLREGVVTKSNGLELMRSIGLDV